MADLRAQQYFEFTKKFDDCEDLIKEYTETGSEGHKSLLISKFRLFENSGDYISQLPRTLKFEAGTRLARLGEQPYEWLKQKGVSKELDGDILGHCIILLEQALSFLSPERRVGVLMNLVLHVYMRYQREQSLPDLSKCVLLCKEAETFVPYDTERLEGADLHSIRFRLVSSVTELASSAQTEDAIHELESLNQSLGNEPIVKFELSRLLRGRFEERGVESDLHWCITLLSETKEDDTVKRWQLCYNLSSALQARFELLSGREDKNGLSDNTMDDKDIRDALNAIEEAYELEKSGNSAVIKMAFANRLVYKYQNVESRTEYLDKAISLGEEALDDRPNDAMLLESQAYHIRIRFGLTQDPDDLDKAIGYADDAIRAFDSYGKGRDDRYSFAPAGNVVLQDYAPTLLMTRGLMLSDLYENRGEIQDLNEATKTLREALTTNAEQSLPYKKWILGRCLRLRFLQTRNLANLTESIDLLESAKQSAPKDCLDQARILSEVADALYLRFLRDKHFNDLEKALGYSHQAMKRTPVNHPEISFRIVNLALMLTVRAEISPKTRGEDLHDSEELYRIALGLPAGIVGRQLINTNFAWNLRLSYVHSGHTVTAYIDESIERLEAAKSSLRQGHRWWGIVRSGLAEAYRYRYKHQEAENFKDIGAALVNYVDVLFSSTTLAPTRIYAARQAAEILMEPCAATETISHLQTAIRGFPELCTTSSPEDPDLKAAAVTILTSAIEIFPLLCPRSLPQTDQLHSLREVAGIASTAASLKLDSGHQPYYALAVLEEGRGITSGFLTETRVDVAKLDPLQASDFRTARLNLEALRSGTSASVSGGMINYSGAVAAEQDVYDAEQKLKAILDDIRSKPRSRNFLRAPSFEELTSEVDGDRWVVINASPYRCDAFLSDRSCGVRLVELSGLKLGDIEKWVMASRKTRPCIDPGLLEWLWEKVAEPVLVNLGLTQPPGDGEFPRITWILTGALSNLPIHAAGRHGNKSGQSVMDRAISTYSTSLRAWIHSRSKRTVMQQNGSVARALLVSMEHTPGKNRLPSATEEVDRLTSLCRQLGFQPVRLEHRKQEAVLHELRSCSIFHFAGHGYCDQAEPSRSGLDLEDGRLTVADLREHWTDGQAPFLAYLSSCLTGANDVDDLVDEALHLLAACQLAGFRHAIGALWQVRDSVCARVAEGVYRGIADGKMSDRSVCLGLLKTVRQLRDEWLEEGARNALQASKIALTEEAISNTTFGTSDLQRDGTRRQRSAFFCKSLRADWVPFVHYGP